MVEFVIMASGPSMCLEDAEQVRKWRDGKNRKAIAINTTYQLAPWADVIYACDYRWWAFFWEAVNAECAGELWCYERLAADSFGLRKAEMHQTGGNSGYQAARLAIESFNATRIILLGFDMQGGIDDHWHGQHPVDEWPKTTPDHFPHWREWLRKLSVEFPSVEFINASRETSLECFPRVNLQLALQQGRE